MRSEWNNPDRTDHYLIALLRAQDSNPKSFKDYIIKFEWRNEPTQEEKKKLANLQARMFWSFVLNMDLIGQGPKKDDDADESISVESR